MYEVPGKDLFVDVALMDQDYQMIDAHIDDQLCKKIVNF